jgi:hypothetical protein
VSVVAGGTGSTLAATALAAEALGRHAAADLCAVTAGAEANDDALERFAASFPLAASCDPFDVYDPASGCPFPGEAAVSVLLARDNAGPRSWAYVAGWGMAEPGALDRAIREALDRARWAPGAIDAVYGSSTGAREAAAYERDVVRARFRAHVPLCNPSRGCGATELPDALALAAAACALREGRAHDDSGRAVRTALVVSADAESGCFALALRAGAGSIADG